MNKQGYLHWPGTPHPFSMVVVWGVWEAGRASGEMTRVVLTYWVWGKECGNPTPASRALPAHPLLPAVFPPSVPLSTLWLLSGAHTVCGG